MPDELTSLRGALTAFATAPQTQSQEHIRPLHAHIVERLVIEGGFDPDDLSPRPPLRVEFIGSGSRRRRRLVFDPSVAAPGEQTVLGGLKTKAVDVVVSQRRLGPCLAVSVKGTGNAFRNLTNRMEEAAGDCTNLHLVYPALVYGFLHVLRANAAGDAVAANDLALSASGDVVDSVVRYHETMSRLAGRRGIRNDVSRYEAVAIALVRPSGTKLGTILPDFPRIGDPLRFDAFFDALYEAYDLRFVYSAPALESRTRRSEWSVDSPVIEPALAAGFNPRVASE